MELALRIAAVGLTGYLIGSVPFTLIVGKLFFGVDPRQHGSGNLGATNAARVLGAKAALAVAVLDITKGGLVVALAKWLIAPASVVGDNPAAWAVVAAILSAIIGHAFSIYIGFKGGKGIAVAAGGLIVAMPIIAAILGTVFVVTAVAFRYASVASMTAASAFPLLVVALDPRPPYVILSAVVCAGVYFLHRTNISRLRAGTEAKISFAKTPGETNDAASHSGDTTDSEGR